MSVAALATERELEFVLALRRGDEGAFGTLVDRYGRSLLHLAMTYVRDRSTAEDVVQETWLAVLSGIDRFEGRSQLATWIFRILTNRAKSRAVREQRCVPFSSLGGEEDGEAAFEAQRFDSSGHWASAPATWRNLPEERLLARESRQAIAAAIEALPPAQARVVMLRDVEGWSAAETCELLAISEANQRVLLHRGRSKVCAALERHLGV